MAVKGNFSGVFYSISRDEAARVARRNFMLKYNIESLDGLDESIKNLYQQSEGGYTLKVDLTGSGYEKVDGLKSALTKIKDERNQLKDRVGILSKFEPLLDVEGFDPSQVNDLIAKANAAGDPEALEKLTRQYEKQLEAEKGKAEAAEQKAIEAANKSSNYIIESEIKSAAIEAGVLKSGVDDAVLLARSRFAFNDNKVHVVDGDGDPTGMTPKEFFAGEFKQSKPFLYEADDVQGSGSKPSKGSFNNEREMTATEKISAGLQAQN